MWDNAALMRLIANVLFAFSAVAAVYGAIHYLVRQPAVFPLGSVHLDAAPQRADVRELLAVVRAEVRGNLFTADIGRLRQSLEKLPWVRGVTIRREFPGRLAVSIEEHEALARWNGRALVNTHGEVFGAMSGEALPDFIGPDAASVEVAQHYAEFGVQLAALNLRIAQLALTPRHAWQLRLDNGLVLELGREEMRERLARFVAVYPHSIATMRGNIKYVDLRYRNGFAVGGAVAG